MELRRVAAGGIWALTRIPAFRSALFVVNVIFPGMFSVMLSPLRRGADAGPLGSARSFASWRDACRVPTPAPAKSAQARADQRALLALHSSHRR